MAEKKCGPGFEKERTKESYNRSYKIENHGSEMGQVKKEGAEVQLTPKWLGSVLCRD